MIKYFLAKYTDTTTYAYNPETGDYTPYNKKLYYCTFTDYNDAMQALNDARRIDPGIILDSYISYS